MEKTFETVERERERERESYTLNTKSGVLLKDVIKKIINRKDSDIDLIL